MFRFGSTLWLCEHVHSRTSLGLAPPNLAGAFCYRAMSDRKALACEIAAPTTPRFIEIPRERGGGKVLFTEEQLNTIRGGLTAEQYRWKLIRQHLKS